MREKKWWWRYTNNFRQFQQVKTLCIHLAKKNISKIQRVFVQAKHQRKNPQQQFDSHVLFLATSHLAETPSTFILINLRLDAQQPPF